MKKITPSPSVGDITENQESINIGKEHSQNLSPSNSLQLYTANENLKTTRQLLEEHSISRTKLFYLCKIQRVIPIQRIKNGRLINCFSEKMIADLFEGEKDGIST